MIPTDERARHLRILAGIAAVTGPIAAWNAGASPSRWAFIAAVALVAWCVWWGGVRLAEENRIWLPIVATPVTLTLIRPFYGQGVTAMPWPDYLYALLALNFAMAFGALCFLLLHEE